MTEAAGIDSMHLKCFAAGPDARGDPDRVSDEIERNAGLKAAEPVCHHGTVVRAFEFTAPLELKLSRAGTGELAGYGSTFGTVDRTGDTVAVGAFARSLAEHKAGDTRPAMLWSHDPGEPIGVWLSATEDAKGLALTGKLNLDTRRGREARSLAKDGALALSIGYRTRDAEYRDGVRVLKDIDLLEVSLVSVPANPEARLTSIKGLTVDADAIRDAMGFERFLKQHGFANSLARRLAAGWDRAVGRQDDDEAAASIIAALKGSAARFSKGQPT